MTPSGRWPPAPLSPFAFPEYNYPHVRTVLIIPIVLTSSSKHNLRRPSGIYYRNGGQPVYERHDYPFKPDLVSAFDGKRHNENVGIHEFVHVLDKEDGAIDGVPGLLQHRVCGAWLQEIKMEMGRIRTGASDINPYTLTNNAEFLAVVSEYFFFKPRCFS